MKTYKKLEIPSGLKEQFLDEIKTRKGIYGGVILESTIEAVKLWLKYPELTGD